MTTRLLRLRDPFSGESLNFRPLDALAETHHGFWESNCRSRRWPHLDGIAFVHTGFVEAAAKAVALLDKGDANAATAYLLTLTDPFAKSAPTASDTAALVARVTASTEPEICALEAMEALALGPVSHYFALRGSVPSFFSGLGLLALGLPKSGTVVDVACGAGHYLYWLARHSYDAIGTDYVFAKLWLARHFIAEAETPLVCADSCDGRHLPIAATDRDVSVFCHDAFYFLPEKRTALERFEQLRRGKGRILLGHAHLSDYNHGSVAGSPLSAASYRALCANTATIFDDAQLARFVTGSENATPITLESATGLEAIALVTPALDSFAAEPPEWPTSEPLGLAPCVRRTDLRGTRPHWPSDSFAQEYATAHYLTSPYLPESFFPRRAARGSAAKSGLTTSTTAGLAVPERFIAASVRPVRWAVVGAGWIACDYMIPAIVASPWAQLIAVVESNHEKRAIMRETLGGRIVLFETVEALLQTAAIDAVYVATPNASHPSIVKQVANYGAHVLCEKPLATSTTEAVDMARHCAARGVRMVTAFDQRYHPAHQRLAEFVADRALGEITQGRINYACWLPSNWQKSRIASPNWRIDRAESGGGAGIDLLPHGLDLLCMLLNDRIVSIKAEVQSGTQEYAELQRGVDDGATLLVRFCRGALATIQVGYNRPEWQPRRQLELFGTAGCARTEDTMGQEAGGHLVLTRKGDSITEIFPVDRLAAPFFRQVDAVSRAFALEEPYPFSIDQDVDNLRLLIDALDAAFAAQAT